MTFDLKIETDNYAFDDDPRPEVARILREVADRVEHGIIATGYRNVRDINGNVVGRFRLV
jgi:hypothetical protein